LQSLLPKFLNYFLHSLSACGSKISAFRFQKILNAQEIIKINVIVFLVTWHSHVAGDLEQGRILIYF